VDNCDEKLYFCGLIFFVIVRSAKINIRSLSLTDLASHIANMGEASFRAKQIYAWLWQKNVDSFDQMLNLSLAIRERLSEHFYIDSIQLSQAQTSCDKTIKYAFSVDEHNVFESVLIPTASRTTACVSSQVGCSLSCLFCATGKLKLLRNLSVGEIVDQVAKLRHDAIKHYGTSLTNIVYMGMGEPLLNYKNVLRSIEIITSPNGMGMSARRITVSTAGIAKMIRKLGDDQVKFNLALSLHAANDEKRNRIMAINETNNLEALGEAMAHFYEKTNTRPTFEYILFDRFNDTIDDARELAHFVRCVPCKINLIEYNPIDNGEFQRSSAIQTERFASFLENKGLIVNIRRSRGKDIDAACGQLAAKPSATIQQL